MWFYQIGEKLNLVVNLVNSEKCKLYVSDNYLFISLIVHLGDSGSKEIVKFAIPLEHDGQLFNLIVRHGEGMTDRRFR